jgi:hypothetical protein
VSDAVVQGSFRDNLPDITEQEIDALQAVGVNIDGTDWASGSLTAYRAGLNAGPQQPVNRRRPARRLDRPTRGPRRAAEQTTSSLSALRVHTLGHDVLADRGGS